MNTLGTLRNTFGTLRKNLGTLRTTLGTPRNTLETHLALLITEREVFLEAAHNESMDSSNFKEVSESSHSFHHVGKRGMLYFSALSTLALGRR